MPHIIELDALEKTVRATLYSAYVKDEKPLSLLIVAKPESAKTQILKKYRENKGVVYLTDCTAFGLTRDILPKIFSGEVKHVMIADLITPLSKSTKTRQSFIAFLNNLIEEGVAKMTTYVNVWEKEVTCGLLAAITEDALEDGRRDWAKMGFLSRMCIFSYSYPIPVICKIFESLVGDKSGRNEVFKLDFPAEPVDVVLAEDIAKELVPISMKIGEAMQLYGFRFFLNTKTMLKSLALMKGRDNVTREEFQEFLELTRYLNSKFNLIGG
jgi:hypothetical protein